jgi:hypothetical protein
MTEIAAPRYVPTAPLGAASNDGFNNATVNLDPAKYPVGGVPVNLKVIVRAVKPSERLPFETIADIGLFTAVPVALLVTVAPAIVTDRASVSG